MNPPLACKILSFEVSDGKDEVKIAELLTFLE